VNSTTAAAGTSSGSAALITTVIVWSLSKYNIQIPVDVALAFASLLMIAIHNVMAVVILMVKARAVKS
jgi:hypothetical protein